MIFENYYRNQFKRTTEKFRGIFDDGYPLLENTHTDINFHKDFDDSFDQKSLADVRSTGKIELVTKSWNGHEKIQVLGRKIVWIGY